MKKPSTEAAIANSAQGIAVSTGVAPRAGRGLRAALSAAIMIVATMEPAAKGAVVTLYPSRDNSIYNEANTSNALGGLFAGETVGGNLRRALVQFDIAGSIPAGSIIDSVTLSLSQTKIGPASSSIFELHAILASWGEGTSAGSGAGGTATPGDATWNHRSFSTVPWTSPGGDFASSVSGTVSIGTANGAYTFPTQPGLVADVQNWLESPGANFGWILKAANEGPGVNSARQFGSRESALAERPALSITYTPVPEPGSAALLAAGAAAALARRRRRLGCD